MKDYNVYKELDRERCKITISLRNFECLRVGN